VLKPLGMEKVDIYIELLHFSALARSYHTAH
jgi:hypothetical protein